MVRKILKYGEPVLEQKAEPITDFNDTELSELIADMWETMYAAKGVGLAAPQIGLSKRVSVIDITVGEDESKKIVIINPEIVSTEGKQTGEEGCLSLPGFREPVTRANKITLRAQNEKGETVELVGEELLARAFLHEIDHLNGILFINHLSALKRDIIRRKIKKLQKAGEWE
ncbi:MAG: peptide deformylase [Acidobacteriaceae bacterium]|nr:peptide deformylase [Acidobacteriaceae bacterium]MBV9294416.1 peptide deformylase [Acidobacteriaceae bacterium]MBV9767221.1 peptide deformylase [Acidobacteriaceae bacterium]